MKRASLGWTKKNTDIKRIVNNEDVIVHFQQVVNVARKTVCGLEGLIRGVDAGRIVPPNALFEAAAKKGLTLKLDRLCRDKALEAFNNVYTQNKDKLLFLNLEASILDTAVGSRYLNKQVEKYGIDPGNIVLEINEAKVLHSDSLKAFIDMYRSEGFLIALDDVGAGFSNLDRIPIVKPDIIKVDMGLVRHIDTDYHKQEVFKSLIRLSAQIGAMVVAEGVETQQEAVETLRLGVHMIQGYLFSKPCALSQDAFANGSIDTVAARFKEYMNNTIHQERRTYQQITVIARKALAQLINESAFNNKLMQIVDGHEAVECAYILDENGMQCSDTVFRQGRCGARENLIFYSAQCGTDHSMKRYYYHLAHGKRDKYMTEPYVSLATGNLCVTFAETFKSVDNKNYILCMDFCGDGR